MGLNPKAERKRVNNQLKEELDMIARLKARTVEAELADIPSVVDGCNEDIQRRRHTISRLKAELEQWV